MMKAFVNCIDKREANKSKNPNLSDGGSFSLRGQASVPDRANLRELAEEEASLFLP